MPDPEPIQPGDVSPAEAFNVLAFLNAAPDAGWVAAAIEFPDEPDIGLRLASRLLARRDELGSFRTLAQVADVPLIGPERFGEIVRALRGRGPRGPGAVGDPFAGLREEIAGLREEIAGLRGRLAAAGGSVGGVPRIALRPVLERPFLGQSVTLVVTVAERRTVPSRADVPVTMVTSWGRLRAADGYREREGAAVTLRTGVDGTARAILSAPAPEDLLDSQQAALETLLGGLDPGAETPADAEEALEELVRQYRWESNRSFRSAVDVYFREFGRELLDRVNPSGALLRWGSFDATVTAYAHDDEREEGEASGVAGLAAATLGFRDWLVPWLEVYRRTASSPAGLLRRLRFAKEEAGRGEQFDSAALLERAQLQVQEFVERERGVVGERLGRSIAARSLRDFIGSELEDVPLDARVELFPALATTADAIPASGTKVVAALGQARTGLRREIREKTGDVDVGPRIEQLESALREQFEQGMGELKVALDAKVDQARFDEALRTKVDQTHFDEVIRRKVDQTRFDDALRTKVDAGRFDEALRAKADTATLTSFRRQVNNRLDRMGPR